MEDISNRTHGEQNLDRAWETEMMENISPPLCKRIMEKRDKKPLNFNRHKSNHPDRHVSDSRYQ